MIKRFMTIVTVIMATMSLQAQSDIDLDNEAMYFDIDELPNAVVWLPAPPDTTSTKFVYDITQYIWGKQQRLDTDRAQQTIDNAVEDVSEMLKQFSCAFWHGTVEGEHASHLSRPLSRRAYRTPHGHETQNHVYAQAAIRPLQ